MERVKLYLKRGKEESLKRFHPWVFSGAIGNVEGEMIEGEIVDVFSSDKQFLGRGHCAIGSITVRILTFIDEEIDTAWWVRRISQAYNMRISLSLSFSEQTNCFRLVHGEGDSLSGLIVDIYNNIAVIQAHSVGMYLHREQIAAAIKEVMGDSITAVYDKSSGTLPFNAEIESVDSYILGNNDLNNGIVVENGCKFNVDWQQGQKTGFFIDQRDNRNLVKHYAKGRRVLNTFCYTGGFSVYALSGGARYVESVDSSARAVEMAVKNVCLNFGEAADHKGVAADAFDYLKNIDQTYDMIILDPPAFAKHHKVTGNALQGYKRVNAHAIKQIAKGGVLFTFSCSQAVSKDQFRSAVFSAAAIAGRNVKILHQLTQPADHPVNIYHTEGEYLKGLVLYVD